MVTTPPTSERATGERAGRWTRRATLAAAATVAAGLAASKWAGAAAIGAGMLSLSDLSRADAGTRVPDLTFLDADGNPHHLADYRGRGVVLNLWATWCSPCVAEMPSLAKLAAQLGREVVVLPLSSDRGGAPAIERFYAERDITDLGVWLDLHGAAIEAVGARGIPTTLLIDKAGTERGRLEGAVDWSSSGTAEAIRRITLA